MKRLLPVHLAVISMSILATNAFGQMGATGAGGSAFGSKPEPEPKYQWEKLHPALLMSPQAALKAFEKGQKDALAKLGYDFELKKVRRPIGPFTNDIASSSRWCCLYGGFSPLSIYLTGYEMQWKYRSEEEVAETKAKLEAIATNRTHTLAFLGTLTILPNFPSTDSSYKTPIQRDLSDVRVVIKVGSKTFQPVHPVLPAMANLDNDLVILDSDTWLEDYYGIADSLRSFWISNLFALKSENYSLMNEIRSVKAPTSYTYRFGVEFDLFNKDGSPRVTEKDKEIKVIVVYGKNSYEVAYNLEEMARIGQ